MAGTWDRLQFITEGTPNVVNLNLIDPEGWFAGAATDLGRRTHTRTYIRQPGVDGATLTTADLEVRQMTIPLYMKPQSDLDDMLDLYGALITELDRLHNVLEVRLPGASASFLIDTYAGDGDSIQNGNDLPDIFERLKTGSPITILLDRAPLSRGLGTYL